MATRAATTKSSPIAHHGSRERRSHAVTAQFVGALCGPSPWVVHDLTKGIAVSVPRGVVDEVEKELYGGGCNRHPLLHVAIALMSMEPVEHSRLCDAGSHHHL